MVLAGTGSLVVDFGVQFVLIVPVTGVVVGSIAVASVHPINNRNSLLIDKMFQIKTTRNLK